MPTVGHMHCVFSNCINSWHQELGIKGKELNGDLYSPCFTTDYLILFQFMLVLLATKKAGL